jgi:hypothetical protein
MTRVELGTGVGATNFTPTDFSYTRTTKDGEIPIVNYLLGSHFNENLDGMFTFSNSTNLENGSITNSGGKLLIAGDAPVGESNETNRATHSTFAYLWPKTKIHSKLEIPVSQVTEISPGVAYDLIARTVVEDISTGDQIIVELHAGNTGAGTGPETNAWLVLREYVSGVATNLATVSLATSTETTVDWQFKFLEEGVSKFSYKTATGEATVLWRGDFKADIAECKVFHELETNEATPTRTVSFDYIWILYKSLFVGFDIPLEKKELGTVVIFDTNNTEVEADWLQVYSKDHRFVGDKVLDNGIVRMRLKSTPEVEIWGWQTFGTPAWVKLGSYIPKNSANTKATNLVDSIIKKYNNSVCVLDVNFGIVSQTFRISKGMSYIRIRSDSKYFDFIPTTKERFALSSDIPGTNLTKWSQEGSHLSNRGNPLGTYQGATNPNVFTFNLNADTGLGKVDDVWYAMYNNTMDDVVCWLATSLKPNALEVEATSTTELKEVRYGFDSSVLIAIGALNSNPTTITSNKPKPFFPGGEDEYVKWKANAAIFAFGQNPFVRKRT